MSFKQFIFLNTIRNKNLYLAYFMSIVFSVMVYFAFSVFSYHPYLIENIGGNVSKGMHVSQVIIYAFALFFVLYSMNVFLQSRKKEFGVLLIQGMSPRQLRSMIFFENILIGVVATITGILLGLVLSSIVILASSWLFEFAMPFYFPLQAMLLTLVAFIILFLLISLIIQFYLPKLSIQTLLKSQEAGQGNLQTSTIKMIASLILIGVGYALALIAKGSGVLFVFIPVLVLVISGTYLFFQQFCVRLAQSLKKRLTLFWYKTNMIVFSDLAFRMKENARSFFLVSIISTVAFVAIGTLQGFQILTTQALATQTADITYTPDEEGDSTVIQKVNQALTDAAIEANRVEINVKQLIQADHMSLDVVAASDYNQALQLAHRPALTIQPNEVVQVLVADTDDSLKKEQVMINGVASPVRHIQASAAPFYSGMLIAGDDLFAQLPAEQSVLNTLWMFSKPVKTSLASKALTPLLEEYPISLYSKAAVQQQLYQFINPTLFVGLFIGIVFFVSAGSFLYFRLYSDYEVDVAKFKMVYKIGLTEKELNRMITQQIAILFLIPLVVSLLHGLVALNALFRMFNQTIAGSSLLLLATFAIIQLVFFVVAKAIYKKKIKKALGMQVA